MNMTDLKFVKDFARLCDDGFRQGWHERNGGNLTYRLSPDEAAEARACFSEQPGPWVEMGVRAPSLAGELLQAKGTGCFMRNVAQDIEGNTGIVEINERGDSYRIRWGLKLFGRPTSEFESHFMNLAIRSEQDGGRCRVCYHMHSPGIIEMSFLVPLEDRAFSRILWQMMTECVVVFPQGVGVVAWMVPGGPAIADATSEKMRDYTAVIWAHHGLFATGATFDEAFGLAHTIEKAAQLYVAARAANGGSDAFLNVIGDQGLRDTCRDFGICVNEKFVSGGEA
ncbi:L-rhamnulose 1-phosphate aldolase [Coriobacterium glomerans PW2]|uniref:L-rhamnulose 1-phosphate aldolase n=1 Tax=Coriobacterium glomerans (strain ATCC 49209 / DSM 20642 / JCM 10262 / PW2) TaxID=700015 RepID=F2NBD1_CORGP|nr:rhamnulose-1-phosphate aldolase [Coriobacterium glomerans]AEB06667.1 L-rhamnulose 1-phosphate aldolase [Coriobacterium glomerans PW2]